MSYEPDLSGYLSMTPTEERFGGRRILNVGWMEPPHNMPTGSVPEGFPERLAAFCTWDKLVQLTMGLHSCPYCGINPVELRRRFKSPLGNGEIRVLGDGVVYAAPSLICHYVSAHSYLPPSEFVSAVINGPGADAPAYVTYRFHWWEGMILDLWPATKRARGAAFGPLVWRYRGMAWAFILLVAIASVRPGGLLVTVPLITALAVAWMVLRNGLRCPACRKRMALPRREQPGWSVPPGNQWDNAWSTMYCNDCGVGLRPSAALWGDTACEVVFNHQ